MVEGLLSTGPTPSSCSSIHSLSKKQKVIEKLPFKNLCRNIAQASSLIRHQNCQVIIPGVFLEKKNYIKGYQNQVYNKVFIHICCIYTRHAENMVYFHIIP